MIYAPTEIFLPYGRPATLDCHFRSNPPLTNLRWEKDGFLFDPYNVQVRIISFYCLSHQVRWQYKLKSNFRSFYRRTLGSILSTQRKHFLSIGG